MFLYLFVYASEYTKTHMFVGIYLLCIYIKYSI